jgi:hypothetical protein
LVRVGGVYQVPQTNKAYADAPQQNNCEVLLGLLGKPAIQLDVPLPAPDCSGGKAMPGLLGQVSMNGVSLIPTLELEGDSVECIHHPWICISKSQGGHGVCKTQEPLVQSTTCTKAALSPTVSRVCITDPDMFNLKH